MVYEISRLTTHSFLNSAPAILLMKPLSCAQTLEDSARCRLSARQWPLIAEWECHYDLRSTFDLRLYRSWVECQPEGELRLFNAKSTRQFVPSLLVSPSPAHGSFDGS